MMQVSTQTRYTAKAQMIFIDAIERLTGYKAAAVVALGICKNNRGNYNVTTYFLTLHGERHFLSFNELYLPIDWKKYAGFIPEVRKSIVSGKTLTYEPLVVRFA